MLIPYGSHIFLNASYPEWHAHVYSMWVPCGQASKYPIHQNSYGPHMGHIWESPHPASHIFTIWVPHGLATWGAMSQFAKYCILIRHFVRKSVRQIHFSKCKYSLYLCSRDTFAAILHNYLPRTHFLRVTNGNGDDFHHLKTSAKLLSFRRYSVHSGVTGKKLHAVTITTRIIIM